MKRYILVWMVLVMVIGTHAQVTTQARPSRSDDFLFADAVIHSDSVRITNDLIRVRHELKNAHRAMFYSIILPGAGQFYVDRSSFTAYIFPVLEIGLIAGIIYYNNKGNEITRDYERFANGETISGNDYDNVWDGYTGPRYNRNYQTAVQNVMTGLFANDIYDSEFFRLDSGNTQHFYEDIGKYNKYVFGWVDWYYQFAADATGTFVLNHDAYNAAWIWSYNPLQPQDRRWLGNIPIATYNPANPGTNYVNPGHPSATPMRSKYVQMRFDAEDNYSTARMLAFGVALNHIGSGLDAVRLVNKRNRMHLASSEFRMHYYASLQNDQLTPMLGFNWKF